MPNLRNPAQLSIIKAFVDEWKIRTSAKDVLYLRYSPFDVFSAVNFENSHIVAHSDETKKDSKFDLIIGDLPMGLRPTEIIHQGEKIKIPINWDEILKSSRHLCDNGTALFLLEPFGFSTDIGQKFEKELNENGFFVNAFFNAPEQILQPETVITPIIVAITKTAPSKLFVAELLNESQSEQIVDSYFSSTDGTDIRAGKFIDLGSFRGFRRLKVKQQIERLETQYKNYSEYTLGKLALEINYVKSGDVLQEKDNSVYIPKIGKSPVVSKLSDTKLKHHNYFQVVLPELASNEYVSAFFRSTLGQLILDSLTSQTYIAHLNKQDLEQALVAIPKLEEQKLIVNTQKTLTRLKSAIDDFDAELALNPASSSSIQNQLETMLDAIGGLTDTDKIYGLIREGESKHIEFKETLSLDVRKQTKEKYIETSALKTVVAFLNTEGGILLIGISDEGKTAGINNELEKFYKNIDKFLLQWKNLLKERIGEGYYPFIEYRVVRVDEKLVLWVECKASPSPCYLDQIDFYVRTNPATDKLEGPKLVEYVKNHFLK
jgi:hypothetical protein